MQRTLYTYIIYITILLCALACPRLRAAETTTPPEDDGIRLSLLTCGPGTEIYSLFGHTALRYEDRRRGIDAVFNYGLFSFDTPNFVLRFTLGETYYQLGATDYKYFLAEYQMTNRDVWQQTLNLSSEEKRRLIALLEENYRPENRVYLYNFFHDNCSTRPRDLVERTVKGRLHYADDMTTTDTGRSFRDIVHQYCKGDPWSQFGIDLCLGSEADRPISRRQMMFAPFYLKDFFATAMLADSTGPRHPAGEPYGAGGHRLARRQGNGTSASQPDDLCPDTPGRRCCRHMVWRPPRKKSVGHRPRPLPRSRPGRMHPRLPGPAVETPCRESQLPALRAPSAAPFLPAMDAEKGHPKGKKPLYDGKSCRFNTFYSALGAHSTKNQFSCITFGTVFAGTFGRQPDIVT